MSMAAILVGTESHLRDTQGWTKEQCGIQPNSEPPPIAGQWYVSIDDAGVNQTARDVDHYLREIFTIEVGIWKRPGQLPADRKREVMKMHSLYFAEFETLESLERVVIRALHKSQTWRATVNTLAGLPTEELGDQIIMPLVYTGRAKNETLIFGRENEHQFFGRRLRFRGGDRTQSLECMR